MEHFLTTGSRYEHDEGLSLYHLKAEIDKGELQNYKEYLKPVNSNK